MPEGLHSDYLKGSSDYPLSGGKRGLGKDAFVPIEDLPGGDNPEDLLIAKQEGGEDTKEGSEDLAGGARVIKTERKIYPVMTGGLGQGSGEVVGIRKAAGTVNVEGVGGYFPVASVKEKRRFLDKQRGSAKRGKR